MEGFLAAVLTGLEHGNEKVRREGRGHGWCAALDVCEGPDLRTPRESSTDLRPSGSGQGIRETIVSGWQCVAARVGPDGKIPPTQSEADAQRSGIRRRHMAPEDRSGTHRRMRGGDVFSLGVILYEILTLHLPWPGNTTAEVLANMRSNALKPPSASGAEVPSPIDAICRKALSRNPSGRYADARELGALVRLFLKSIEQRERPPEAAGIQAKPAKEPAAPNRVATENEGLRNLESRVEGTLSVRAQAFPCRCLVDGRSFPPSELEHLGYNPLSGGSKSGRADAQGITAFERTQPMRLKAHGPNCRAGPLVGADVWAFRFEEEDGLLRPMTPDQDAAGAPGVPEAVIRELYPGQSPFRPQGPGLHLGRTPIESAVIPAGSWLLVVSAAGRRPVRASVFLHKGRQIGQVVTLYEPPELPGGFVQVPGGEFAYQGDRSNPHSGPRELRAVAEFFIARHPVVRGLRRLAQRPRAHGPFPRSSPRAPGPRAVLARAALVRPDRGVARPGRARIRARAALAGTSRTGRNPGRSGLLGGRPRLRRMGAPPDGTPRHTST